MEQALSNLPLPQCPAVLNQVDKEFLLFYFLNKAIGTCNACQAVILHTFYRSFLGRNPSLQLTPAHLWNPADRVLGHRLCAKEFKAQIQVALGERLIWRYTYPADFENMWEQKWLPLFTQEAAGGEWMTKVWHACAGSYTILDLERGRKYTGSHASFEDMHMRRLLAGSQPHLGDACKCREKNWRMETPEGRPPRGPAAEAHHGVLFAYTNPLIRDAYRKFLVDHPVRLNGVQIILPLARVWNLPSFQEVLSNVAQAAPSEREERLKMLQNVIEKNQAGLAMLELSRGC
jgi:hypothetical protein